PHERLMGIFVFQEAQPLFVLPAMEVNQLKDAGWQYEIIGYADHENPWKLIQSSLESKKLPKAKAVSLEKEGLSLSRSEALLRFFPEADIVSAEDKLNEMRIIKDESEIAVIKRATEMADYGVQVGVNALQEGITEMEVL